jgi:hypothetical protein
MAAKRPQHEITGQLTEADLAKAQQVAAKQLRSTHVDAVRVNSLRLHLSAYGYHTASMDGPEHAFYRAVHRKMLTLAIDELAPSDLIALADMATMFLAYPPDAEFWRALAEQEAAFRRDVLPKLKQSRRRQP